MGTCAGCAGPQRRNRQSYLPKNSNKKEYPDQLVRQGNPNQFKDIKKQPSLINNRIKSNAENQGLILTSKFMAGLNLNGDPLNGRSPLIIKQLQQNGRQKSQDLGNVFLEKQIGHSVLFQKGKNQAKDKETSKKYESIRDIDLRNSQHHTNSSRIFKPTESQLSPATFQDKSTRIDGGELERIQQMLQNTKERSENLRNGNQNSPQSYSRIIFESRNSTNGKGQKEQGLESTYSHVSPYALNSNDMPADFAYSRAGLAIKKKGDLQIIQQLIYQQVKTPQYIKGLREKRAEDIPDFKIDFTGKLPSFQFTPIYTYLKDLQSWQMQQQKSQHEIMLQSK